MGCGGQTQPEPTILQPNQVSPTIINNAKEIFNSLDVDHDKQISLQEATTGFAKMDIKWSEDQIKTFIYLVDADFNGQLDFNEFKRFLIVAVVHNDPEMSREDMLFYAADLDCSGRIDKKEFLVICAKLEYQDRIGMEKLVDIVEEIVGEDHLNHDTFGVLMARLNEILGE
ncbi:hypothetical protein SS50377_28174 [Spironucleus salmonicida]|uniref:EF-hand domain-containing protein n=1 Tax=Spironucleus salmonicida TaxID=348837 RepID=V6LNY2_9EUKA|nr:hypothetical protein SS50377_28174 [Spironucleus salmonicida]|eukprot:EST46382.1 hypothetical protein SS50377_13625 [Spironucleus salmonicida]